MWSTRSVDNDPSRVGGYRPALSHRGAHFSEATGGKVQLLSVGVAVLVGPAHSCPFLLLPLQLGL
jgi:hypothetical protein